MGAVSPRLEFAEGTVKFLPRLVFRWRFPRRSRSPLCQLHGRASYISRSVSQGLLLALASLALFSLRSFGQDNAKNAEVSPMEAVLQLHLPHRDGVASMYYSACCTERAVEIQKSVQDMIAFYSSFLPTTME
jgi:hypothetical protein